MPAIVQTLFTYYHASYTHIIHGGRERKQKPPKKQPEVGFTYDSDQQLEFPESLAPPIDNNKRLGHLSRADWPAGKAETACWMKTTSLKLMSWTLRPRKNRDTARIGQQICGNKCIREYPYIDH
jgi:hypothetical protein